MMNPSPTEIVELFTFVEVTLAQYATVTGRFPGVAAAAMTTKPKRANKAEVVVDEQPKEEPQACAVTPRPKNKGSSRGSPPTSPAKAERAPEAKKGGGKGKRSQNLDKKSGSNIALHSTEVCAKARSLQL